MPTAYKTMSAKPSTVTKEWIAIDGTDQVVGRLASRIAVLLMGKHKTYYTPHMPCGDYVVVTNVDKVRFTGRKEREKRYVHHTGYPGGLKETTPAKLRAKWPERILAKAIKGMLPKNKLGRQIAQNAKLYAGSEHPHLAQGPKKLA